MAEAIEAAVRPAVPRDIAEWLRGVAGAHIDRLAATMQGVDSGTLTRAGGVTSSVPSGPLETSSSAPSESSIAPEPRRRGWTMPAALFAFAAVMLLVGLRTLASRGTAAREQSDDASSSVVAAISAPPAAAPIPIVVMQTPPPIRSSAPSASVSAPAPPRPAPAAVVWQPRPAPRAPEVAPVAVTTAAPATAHGNAAEPRKPSCEIPFVIGADGIRQIKPECM
jgi:serine/threonine-protein kinase